MAEPQRRRHAVVDIVDGIIARMFVICLGGAVCCCNACWLNIKKMVY